MTFGAGPCHVDVVNGGSGNGAAFDSMDYVALGALGHFRVAFPEAPSVATGPVFRNLIGGNKGIIPANVVWITVAFATRLDNL